MSSAHGPLVVDANVLFSALIRDGTTRGLILHGQLELHTPDHIWDEFERNRAYLLKKSRATEAAFDLLVDTQRDRIADVPPQLIKPHMEEALERTGAEDALDAPYIAAALAVGAAIWSHDKRLARDAGMPVRTTADLVTALGVD